ncbi:MAG: 50S ribosomal protein L4 [Patescibacteria group bacterium]
METTIYNAQGKNIGSVALPESVFGVKWNNALMHQVVTAMQSNVRPRIAHTKTRGEVRGGGKKPWAQKGTGRARHGSIRSPIWRGGGVTHGPRSEKNYTRTIPKRMRAKALFMAISRKFKDGEIIFIDSFGITAPKTAIAKTSLNSLASIPGFEKLSSKKRNAALIAFSSDTGVTRKSFNNLGNVKTVDVRNLNPVSILGSTYLIIENPKEAVPIISKRVSSQIK